MELLKHINNKTIDNTIINDIIIYNRYTDALDNVINKHIAVTGTNPVLIRIPKERTNELLKELYPYISRVTNEEALQLRENIVYRGIEIRPTSLQNIGMILVY